MKAGGLKKKSDQLTKQSNNPNNKYAVAWREVTASSTPEQVSQALSNNNVSFKNGMIMGGKKHKKSKTHKNKKGGYTYKKYKISSGKYSKGGRRRIHRTKKHSL